ncbi:MAG TPA: acyltransferase [Streptosporangiaceae bacterium]|nr:acyltransferase [Streptosporangiaceae bacterium]
MLSTATVPDGGSRLPSLTGLRFLAALSVFLFHTGLPVSPIPSQGGVTPFADKDVAADYAFVLGHAGPLGVSFFFVLSGFVLTWSSRPGESARAWLRRRVVKIYPNHVVIWAVALLLFARAAGGPGDWLANLLLIHSFFPQPSVIFSVNPPSWSLSSEMLFYLSFPFLIGPLRRIPVRRLWIWAAAMVAGTVAVQLVAQFVIPAGAQAPINPMPDLQFWFGYFFPPNHMFEFVLGVLLARLVLAGKWPRIGIVPAGVLLLAGYTAALYMPVNYGLIVSTIAPIGVLIASVADADARGRRTPFGGRVMVWLGEVSYAFYLCQGVTLFYVRHLFADTLFPTGEAILVIIGLTALNLLAAWLLHSCVEEPMMRRWSRARRPRRSAESTPAAATSVAVPHSAGETTPPAKGD